jgi:hypothetical protein
LLLEYGWPDEFRRDAYLAEYADNMQQLKEAARNVSPEDPAVPESSPTATPAGRFDKLLEMLEEDPDATAEEEGFFMQYLSQGQKEQYFRSKAAIQAEEDDVQDNDVEMGEQVPEPTNHEATSDAAQDELPESA